MQRSLKISVHVEEDVWISFKNYVLSKYGCLYKYLGEELTRAIKLYLKHSSPAHTQTFEHKLSKPNRKHVKLLAWIAENFNHEITHTDLETYIVKNFGKDYRTKKSYINEFLVRFGFIKHKKALFGRNVIYEIDRDRIIGFLRQYLTEEEMRNFAICEKTVMLNP